MLFSNPIIKELKKLSKNADAIQTNEELKESSEQLNRIFEHPFSQQIIKELREQLNDSSSRLTTLKEVIIKDFDFIEYNCLTKTKCTNSAIIYCLDASKKEQEKLQEKFPTWREAGLRVALRYSIKEEIGILQNESESLYIDILIADKFIKIESLIDDIIKTANVIAWEKEYQANKTKSEVLQDISYIKRFKSGISQADPRRLKVTIQNVSTYFAKTANTVDYLKAEELNEIGFSYTYNKDPKKVFIIIFFNKKMPLKIEALRAKNLYKLLSNPWQELDISEFEFSANVTPKKDSSKNEHLRKEFDAINQQICKKYFSYGFIYGANELIESKGYSHKINHDHAHLIKKNN